MIKLFPLTLNLGVIFETSLADVRMHVLFSNPALNFAIKQTQPTKYYSITLVSLSVGTLNHLRTDTLPMFPD